MLRHVKASDGKPLVAGKRVTGFSNSEEAAVGLTEVVPFLLEDLLQELGGDYQWRREGEYHLFNPDRVAK